MVHLSDRRIVEEWKRPLGWADEFYCRTSFDICITIVFAIRRVGSTNTSQLRLTYKLNTSASSIARTDKVGLPVDYDPPTITFMANHSNLLSSSIILLRPCTPAVLHFSAFNCSMRGRNVISRGNKLNKLSGILTYYTYEGDNPPTHDIHYVIGIASTWTEVLHSPRSFLRRMIGNW